MPVLVEIPQSGQNFVPISSWLLHPEQLFCSSTLDPQFEQNLEFSGIIVSQILQFIFFSNCKCWDIPLSKVELYLSRIIHSPYRSYSINNMTNFKASGSDIEFRAISVNY